MVKIVTEIHQNASAVIASSCTCMHEGERRTDGAPPDSIVGWGGAHILSVVLVVQWLGVGLVIQRSLVRLPAGALSS